jgi:hypothetical protein
MIIRCAVEVGQSNSDINVGQGKNIENNKLTAQQKREQQANKHNENYLKHKEKNQPVKKSENTQDKEEPVPENKKDTSSPLRDGEVRMEGTITNNDIEVKLKDYIGKTIKILYLEGVRLENNVIQYIIEMIDKKEIIIEKIEFIHTGNIKSMKVSDNDNKILNNIAKNLLNKEEIMKLESYDKKNELNEEDLLFLDSLVNKNLKENEIKIIRSLSDRLYKINSKDENVRRLNFIIYNNDIEICKSHIRKKNNYLEDILNQKLPAKTRLYLNKVKNFTFTQKDLDDLGRVTVPYLYLEQKKALRDRGIEFIEERKWLPIDDKLSKPEMLANIEASKNKELMRLYNRVLKHRDENLRLNAAIELSKILNNQFKDVTEAANVWANLKVFAYRPVGYMNKILAPHYYSEEALMEVIDRFKEGDLGTLKHLLPYIKQIASEGMIPKGYPFGIFGAPGTGKTNDVKILGRLLQYIFNGGDLEKTLSSDKIPFVEINLSGAEPIDLFGSARQYVQADMGKILQNVIMVSDEISRDEPLPLIILFFDECEKMVNNKTGVDASNQLLSIGECKNVPDKYITYEVRICVTINGEVVFSFLPVFAGNKLPGSLAFLSRTTILEAHGQSFREKENIVKKIFIPTNVLSYGLNVNFINSYQDMFDSMVLEFIIKNKGNSDLTIKDVQDRKDIILNFVSNINSSYLESIVYVFNNKDQIDLAKSEFIKRVNSNIDQYLYDLYGKHINHFDNNLAVVEIVKNLDPTSLSGVRSLERFVNIIFQKAKSIYEYSNELINKSQYNEGDNRRIYFTSEMIKSLRSFKRIIGSSGVGPDGLIAAQNPGELICTIDIIYGRDDFKNGILLLTSSGKNASGIKISGQCCNDNHQQFEMYNSNSISESLKAIIYSIESNALKENVTSIKDKDLRTFMTTLQKVHTMISNGHSGVNIFIANDETIDNNDLASTLGYAVISAISQLTNKVVKNGYYYVGGVEVNGSCVATKTDISTKIKTLLAVDTGNIKTILIPKGCGVDLLKNEYKDYGINFVECNNIYQVVKELLI